MPHCHRVPIEHKTKIQIENNQEPEKDLSMYRKIAIIIIGAIFLSSTLAIPIRSAGFIITYDFTNRIQNKAYYGSDANQPPGTLDIGTELPWQQSQDEYQQIAFSDDIRAWYAGDYSDYHRFKFKINETAESISHMYIEHEGYGSGAIDRVPGLRLFIWNYDTDSWQFLSEHNANETDAIASGAINAEFSKYLDSSGYLNLLAQTKENGGSCPFLYTFNGKKYVFIADLYGNGIIDIPYNRPEPEDYAKIGTDQLQPDNGYYQLQIAQEYDEISYLDKLSLITVDHPSQVDVYEPLLKADFGKVYTVSKTKAPESAFNEKGLNVLEQISKKDNIYTSGNQYSLNLLDLNLGDLSNAKQIKLVISAYTYWIPGSSNSQIKNPYGRFVQVKDRTGSWMTIYENSEIMNPAAMPRTYVLNLTGKFSTNDYSVRIGFYPDVRFDYVGVDTSSEQPLQINTLSPLLQIFTSGDIPSLRDTHQFPTITTVQRKRHRLTPIQQATSQDTVRYPNYCSTQTTNT